MTERIFELQAGYFLTLSIGVCTTRHWQTSDRLVKELNVCTVEACNLLVPGMYSGYGNYDRDSSNREILGKQHEH